jgi:uncharacterized protein (TIRG00374 family)
LSLKKFIKKIKGGSALKYLLHAAILIGVGMAAARYLDRDQLLASLQRFDYIYLPLILGASTVYIFLKGWRFVVLMRPVTDVPWGTMVRGYIAGTPATLLPGGVAVRAGLMSQAGVPLEKSAGPVAYSSILDQVIFLLGLFVAAFWVDAARTPALSFLGLLVLFGILLLIPQFRRWLGRAAEWGAKKFNFLERWQQFLSALAQVSAPQVLLVGLFFTLAGLVLQIVMLDLSLRAFGVTLPYPTLFLAYILPAMLGRLSAVPAGVGLTEASMVGFLAASAGTDIELLTAATVIFRLGSVMFDALLGALVYFFFWGGEKEQFHTKS